MLKQHPWVALAVTVGLCLGASSASHGDSLSVELTPRVITTAGELLEARTGTYEELFPGATQLPGATPVLALDVLPQEGPGGRLLVPGTDDERFETQPLAIFEPAEESANDTLLLLWQSISQDGATRHVRFVSVRRGSAGLQWSEVFTVRDSAGDDLVLRQAPQFAITRQDFSQELEEQAFSSSHTLVHLLWEKEGLNPLPMYSAVVWVDGLYVGFNPVFDLASFLSDPATDGDVNAFPSNLNGSTQLEVATGGQSLEVTFADATAGRVGHLTIDAVPLAHGVLGDLVRDEMFAHADSFDPGEMQPFVDKFRAGVVIIGREFKYHPAVVEYVVSRVGDWLLTHGEGYGFEEFVGMGEDARDLTIGLTHSVYTSNVVDPANPGSTLVELDLSEVLGGGTTADQPGQLLDFRVGADLAAPTIGEGETALLASSDGGKLTVTWLPETGERLFYVESREDGSWSETQSLGLRDGLSADEALRLLESKLR